MVSALDFVIDDTALGQRQKLVGATILKRRDLPARHAEEHEILTKDLCRPKLPIEFTDPTGNVPSVPDETHGEKHTPGYPLLKSREPSPRTRAIAGMRPRAYRDLDTVHQESFRGM